jgi:3-oxoadipate enol-lactonase
VEIRTVRNIRIAFDLRTGGDELVVFIHGVGADRTSWKYQLEAFQNAGYSVAAIDMRGSGDSQSRDEHGALLKIDLEEFARDVDALIRELGFSKAHWVGNSKGGVIILEALLLGLASVDKIVLCNTFAKHPDSAAILPRAAAALRQKTMPEFAAERIPLVLKPDIDAATLAEAIYAMARKDPEAYLASWQATWSPDFRGMLSSITNPTLVVSSTLDMITPTALSDELACHIPHAKLVVLEGAGHISNLDQPEAFNQAVLAFLQS